MLQILGLNEVAEHIMKSEINCYLMELSYTISLIYSYHLYYIDENMNSESLSEEDIPSNQNICKTMLAENDLINEIKESSLDEEIYNSHYMK